MAEKSKAESRTQPELKSITQLDLYAMSKDSLVQKIKTLLHQLRVTYRIIQQQPQLLACRQPAEMQTVIQSLTHNQEQLHKQLASLQNQSQRHKEQLSRKDEEAQKLAKENRLLKKKIAMLQKGKSKVEQNLCKERQMQTQKAEAENAKLKRQIKALAAKVKIFEELNRQTELQLAEKMVSTNNQTLVSTNKQTLVSTNNQTLVSTNNQTLVSTNNQTLVSTNNQTLVSTNNQTSSTSAHSENKDGQKQNDSKSMNMVNQKKLKVQIMSLKEEARQLRERLRVSEEEKEHLKNKIQQRQLFYSKMVSSRH